VEVGVFGQEGVEFVDYEDLGAIDQSPSVLGEFGFDGFVVVDGIDGGDIYEVDERRVRSTWRRKSWPSPMPM
jgi:hypothetical protein